MPVARLRQAKARSRGHRSWIRSGSRPPGRRGQPREPIAGMRLSATACPVVVLAADQRLRAHQRSSPGSMELRTAGSSAGFFVIVPVVVRMVSGGRSALTGRVGRHSTAGLAVVAAARLVPAQLDEGVGRSHPQFRRERRVVGDPVGQQGPRVWSRRGVLTGLWHNPDVTTDAVLAPAMAPRRGDAAARQTAQESLPRSRPG